MEIRFDFEEMAKLAENRDVSTEKLILEYVDEVLKKDPELSWDVYENLNAEGIFRCISCGFWIPVDEMSIHRANMCETCEEVS